MNCTADISQLISVAKRSRAGKLSRVTTETNKLDALIVSKADVSTVKEHIVTVKKTLDGLWESCQRVIWLCEQAESHDDTLLSEANNYYALHEMPTLEILQRAGLYVDGQSQSVLDDQFDHLESASVYSQSSTSSSAFAKVAARKGALLTRVKYLEQQHELERQQQQFELQEKLRVEQKRLEMNQKLERLKIDGEITAAEAEEDILESYVTEARCDTSTLSNQQKLLPAGFLEHLKGLRGERADVKLNPDAPDWLEGTRKFDLPESAPQSQVGASGSLFPPVDTCNHDNDPNLHGLRGARRECGSIITDQHLVSTLHSLRLPALEIAKFDGDPLKYWSFVHAFDNMVGDAPVASSIKLSHLLHCCVGKAHKVIECCAIMQPDVGHAKARDLLRMRFGSDYRISEAWVQKIASGPPVKLQSVQDLADDVRSCKETLSAMGMCGEIENRSLMVRVVQRLPSTLQGQWRHLAIRVLEDSGHYPGIDRLVNFLGTVSKEVTDPVFGALAMTNNGSHAANHPVKGKGLSFAVEAEDVGGVPCGELTASASHVTDIKTSDRCVLCSGYHSLFGCNDFKNLKPEKRLDLARSHKLCYNCLLPGHVSASCALNRVCSVPGCSQKHTKFLHQIAPNVRTFPDKREDQSKECAQSSSNTGVAFSISRNTPKVSLPIVPVRVKALGENRTIDTYALLDAGSTSSFCTAGLMSELGVDGKKETLSLTTLESKDKKTDTFVIGLEVCGIRQEDWLELPTVYTRPDLAITCLNKATYTDLQSWDHLKELPLPEVSNTEVVTILIGQDCPEALMPLEVKRGDKGSPYAVRSALGWSVNGLLGSGSRLCASSHFVQSDMSLEQQVARFWKIDVDVTNSVDDDKGMSVDDRKTLTMWKENVAYKEGHYELPVPFKSSVPCLPDNRAVAETRLGSLGRRLKRSQVLSDKYRNGMRELLEKGYAQQVPSDEISRSDGKTWYLPHHPVFNANKPEKLRIVFDCAARFQGSSLNAAVNQGPDLTNKLLGILLRFREGRIALMADIECMFHQFRVAQQDRDALRFLWWPDGDMSQIPTTYRMNVHLFGGSWSPSCCAYALQCTADDFGEAFTKEAIWAVRRDIYVDDFLRSLDDVNLAIVLQSDVRNLLHKGGFRLTKWISNNRKVLESIPIAERAKEIKELDLNYEALPTERALGLFWDVELDMLCFRRVQRDKPLTRRGLLSIVSSIYDPLGLICPCTVVAKKIVQDLCAQNLGWDEPLPDQQLTKWLSWVRDMECIEEVKVDRWMLPEHFGELISCQLHHFSDASNTA